MSKKVIETVEAWMEERLRLEQDIENKLNALPLRDGTAEGIEAGQAKTRMEAFLSYHRSRDRMSAQTRKEYGEIQMDYEEKSKKAASIKAKYQQAKDRLDSSRQALKDLQFPEIERTTGYLWIEPLIRKSMSGRLSVIKDLKAVIDKLKEKRLFLSAELNKTKPTPQPLDEKSLLDVDVQQYHSLKIGISEKNQKALSIKDLIDQMDDAINTKERHLQSIRADFSSAYRSLIVQCVSIATNRIIEKFKQIMDMDIACADAVGKITMELVDHSGADPDAIFGNNLSGIQELKTNPLKSEITLLNTIKRYLQRAV